MKRVLRGLVYDGLPERAAAGANFEHVDPDRFLFPTEPQERVLRWLVDFWTRTHEAPQANVAFDHFEQAGDAAAGEVVQEALSARFFEGASYAAVVEEVVHHQAKLHMRSRFKEALQIADPAGWEQRPGVTVQGLTEAAAHVFSALRLPPPKGGGAVPTDMTAAGDYLRDLYEARKANPSQAFGVMSGYRCIDQRAGGTRKGALYIHAGFAGHLKSTLLENQAVRAACAGEHGIIFTSEMPAEDVMLTLIAIHSGDPKFQATGVRPLDARRLLAGALDDAGERSFREARKDFLAQPGSIRIYDSADFRTFGAVQQITAREHARRPVDVVWIDYLTRLELDPKYVRYDFARGMNLTIRDAKQWALGFNGGAGLPVISAFQINREGNRAGEGGGKLSAHHLGEFNAAEKEADLITYTWFGEEQQAANEVLLGMMKNRWGPRMGDRATLFIHPKCRRIDELATATASMIGMDVDEGDQRGVSLG